MNLDLHDRWTPRQTLRVLDCIQALYDAIWDANEDRLHFYIDGQVDRLNANRPPTKLPRPETQGLGFLRDSLDDDGPF
jgi:hypothetical protein